ncbi:hypothetical protein [Nevskia sp.]|uniref:P-loop ATPase, Sll1717 family n=1 Tax=Nevskia sp. TaxID=1929292 RepID=UPI0025F6937C|nr:hypothetical protein [Nevskia sp.]
MEPTTSLSTLATFGDIAAEQDAVLDYFVSTSAVSEIASKSKFLVLGRKGSGKTAIVRHFTENNGGMGLSRALSLKGYPWAIHAERADKGAASIETYVSSWRYLIAVEMAMLALQNPISMPWMDDAKSLIAFLKDNYGSTTVQLRDILTPAKLQLNKASFEPTVLGCKLGSISLERQAGDLRLGQELNALTDAILASTFSLCKRELVPSLTIHFDELDQGLTAFDEARKHLVIGLILAVRQVNQSASAQSVDLKAIVYLRTDLWDDLQFSDKNKINQGQTLNLLWDGESLLKLVNARLEKRLGPGVNWTSIASADVMRGTQSKWGHITSRTFLRPRDVISFLNNALNKAKRRTDDPLIFSNQDIVEARVDYSLYLKQELDDEITPHWPCWAEALQACSRISTITFSKDQFVTEYRKVKTSKNMIAPDDALRLLYDFSVIGYQARSGYGGSSWTFQYTDPAAGWDNSVSSFKVHAGLKEYAKLAEGRAAA